MKLCIDCKHFNEGSGKGFERCDARQNDVNVEPVRGEKTIKHWDFCESHRKPGRIQAIFWRACGKNARWFEPKKEQE